MTDFTHVMEQYQNGNEEQKQNALQNATGALSDYVLAIAKTEYSSYCNKYLDDIYQSGLLGIVMGIANYIPAEKSPEEYFKPFITGEIDRLVRILK